MNFPIACISYENNILWLYSYFIYPMFLKLFASKMLFCETTAAQIFYWQQENTFILVLSFPTDVHYHCVLLLLSSSSVLFHHDILAYCRLLVIVVLSTYVCFVVFLAINQFLCVTEYCLHLWCSFLTHFYAYFSFSYSVLHSREI